MMTAPEEYDVVIVGAGSAGCVLAHRIASGSEARVLLLEAGGPDSRAEIHDELLSSTMSLWAPGELDWGYVTLPQAGLADRPVPIARGRVLGGSSSVNAMLHVRGNRRDYDGWAARGNPGWGYDDVLPYFVRSEDFEGGASRYRGSGGPLSVIYHADPTPVSERLFEAGAEVGLENQGPRFDYNAERQDGVVFTYQATKTREHHRASTAVAYLDPVRALPNLTVRTGATVVRVLIVGGHAVGVELLGDSGLEQVRASSEVVVSCGAFNSPQLLLRSGIGPADQLYRSGIDVHSELAAVGNNLQDHMILGVAYLSQQEHPFEPTLIAETGFFTHTADADPEGSPDLQMTFGGLKFVAPGLDRPGPGFTFAPVLVQPLSCGWVRLNEDDAMAPAQVQPNYLSQYADLEVLLAGIELARELAATGPLSDFVKEEIAPGPDVRSRDELAEFIRGNAGTLWHPVGTCAMGTGPDAVVDSELRVYGIDGLRVADASVMPRITAGNTNAACVMIGEKASDLVLAGFTGSSPSR